MDIKEAIELREEIKAALKEKGVTTDNLHDEALWIAEVMQLCTI